MRYPREIDVFLNLGAIMPDQESGAPKVPRAARIIHGGIEMGRLGENYPLDLAIVADPGEIAAALTAAIKSMLAPARLAEIRDARYQATRRFTEAMRAAQIQAARAAWDSTPITWERLASDINEMLEKDACIVPEFGTEGPKALNRFPIADSEKTRIGRTRGRALGWGIGAAIGAKLARPDQQVVALQGDGGFLFGQTEALWSMSRYDVPVIIVIFNNRSYNETRARMFGHGGRQGNGQGSGLLPGRPRRELCGPRRRVRHSRRNRHEPGPNQAGDEKRDRGHQKRKTVPHRCARRQNRNRRRVNVVSEAVGSGDAEASDVSKPRCRTPI
jgi:thiamine pyrophosphate-dependent acetolactate synthase large subunit-like protein